MNLEVSLGRMKLKNPIILAAGTYGYGLRFKDVINSTGAIITKSITVSPCEGNSPPRLWDTKYFLLNSIGLENPGVKKFKEELLPKIQINTKFVVSIAGSTVEEFETLTEELEETNIDAFELNLSCPNIKKEKELIGASPPLVYEVVKKVRERTTKPIWVKLTPNYCNPFEIAKNAEEAGADALTVFNTFFGLAIDIQTRTSRLGGLTGGLSSPGLKPFVLYTIWQLKKIVSIPIIASSGGVMNAEDVVEYMLGGAEAVQLGSINLRNPKAPLKILKDLESLLEILNIKEIKTIIGKWRYDENRTDSSLKL